MGSPGIEPVGGPELERARQKTKDVADYDDV